MRDLQARVKIISIFGVYSLHRIFPIHCATSKALRWRLQKYARCKFHYTAAKSHLANLYDCRRTRCIKSYNAVNMQARTGHVVMAAAGVIDTGS